jgi:methyltransferase
MSVQFLVSFGALVILLLFMLAEQRYSLANERALRQLGAVEPAGDVYPTMRWAYPCAFVGMAIEGAVAGVPGITTLIGAAILVAAKILKFWAIKSLGPRWTFRVLVPPDAPLVSHGPYAFVNHPNYIAVVGELIGFAVVVGARLTGLAATVGFGLLLLHRIRVENRALRHPPCT